jgi:outer membrane protein assembly factor BamB
MTLIELGEVSSGSSEPPAAPRRADIRRIAVAAVAALCVLTVTGSERPEPRSLPTLWTMSVGNDPFTLTSDAVYVLDQETSALTAYSAADGAPRWTRALPAPAGWISGEVPGTLLLPMLSSEVVDGGAGNPYPDVLGTVAIDAAGGAVRWRQPGEAAIGTPDVVVLSEWSDTGGLRSLRGVRTGDGTAVWRYDATERISSWTVTGAAPRRPDRLVTVTAAGRIAVRRLADGAPVAEATVAWQAGTSPQDDSSYLFSAGPHLLVVHTDGAEQTIIGYDPETLRPRWDRAFPLSAGAFDCGDLLCTGTESGEVTALDPATGEVRWRGSGWEHAEPGGDGMLLVQSRDQARLSLIDSDTGRPVADFGPGSAVVDRDAGAVIVMGVAGTQPPRQTVLQYEAGEVFLRGAITLTGGHGCQLAAGRLACLGSGTLSVTDVG